MIQASSLELRQHKKLVTVWSITFLILFPVLITFGLLMRMKQGEVLNIGHDTFYALMTLHGLGMAGVLFSIAWAALFYLIGTRYARLNIKVGYFIYFLVLIGTVELVIASLIGKFGAGWYMLYPLPFKGANWASWSTGLSIIALIVLGVAWLIGSLHVVYALSNKYGSFYKLMGWNYLGKKEPEQKLPSIVLITTASLVPAILSFLAGAVFLVMNLMQQFEPTLAFDPLLLKNLVFFFGHTLVNVTMYLGVAWVYALLPEYTKREWGVNKVVVLSWNGTFIFIMFAYFHHLYMDFAQPLGLHYAGQLASYFSAIPATVVTMFGVIVQFYHSKMKWSIIPMTFLIGIAGWAIGGFAAVVDSTISVNKILHNTLWVPAHFHTYMLLGIVLFIFGFLFYLAYCNSEERNDPKPGFGFWTFVVGSFGFVLMFYLGGMNSVPRRYSDYVAIESGNVHHTGALLAKIAAVFVGIILIGLFSMYGSLFVKLLKPSKANS